MGRIMIFLLPRTRSNWNCSLSIVLRDLSTSSWLGYSGGFAVHKRTHRASVASFSRRSKHAGKLFISIGVRKREPDQVAQNLSRFCGGDSLDDTLGSRRVFHGSLGIREFEEVEHERDKADFSETGRGYYSALMCAIMASATVGISPPPGSERKQGAGKTLNGFLDLMCVNGP